MLIQDSGVTGDPKQVTSCLPFSLQMGAPIHRKISKDIRKLPESTTEFCIMGTLQAKISCFYAIGVKNLERKLRKQFHLQYHLITKGGERLEH